MHAKMPPLPAILDGGEQCGIARTSTLVTHRTASDQPRFGPVVIDKDCYRLGGGEALTSAVSRDLEKNCVGSGQYCASTPRGSAYEMWVLW